MGKGLVALLLAVAVACASCATSAKEKIEEVLPPEKIWFSFYDKGMKFKTDPDKEFRYEIFNWLPLVPDFKYPEKDPFLVSEYVGEGISPFGKLILSRYVKGNLEVVGDITGDGKLDGRFCYSNENGFLEYRGREEF